MQKRNFKINTSIYSEGAIASAIEQYSEIANIQYSAGEIVIEGEDDTSIEEIFNEFMNFVLSLVVELHS